MTSQSDVEILQAIQAEIKANSARCAAEAAQLQRNLEETTATLLAIGERLLALNKRLEEIPGELRISFRSQFSCLTDEMDKGFSRTTEKLEQHIERASGLLKLLPPEP